ncbi:MAG: sugar transferase [Bacteroidia bacterium]|nr:sugar transferase [Bacteroidia bacterium]MCZ2276601.1 sugar transferase [Bacteroidia bacterium]
MLKYFYQKSVFVESKSKPTVSPFTNAKKSILTHFGADVLKFINRYTLIDDPETLVVSTRNAFNINALASENTSCIVNLGKVNDILRINYFFEMVNARLPKGGCFIGCVETKGSRKIRLLNKYPKVISHFIYYGDFIVKRVFPKLPVTRKIYFKLTAGRNRVLSRTETLGRLYACGFTILDEKMINNRLFFVAQKKDEPTFEPEPTYGPIYKMKRIGKDGKIIHVYKLRTMHAFADHLQQYVYEHHSLQEGGKFKNDFRVSTVGKLFRKYWIDELPMIYNLIKGDLKIVGVRPLSRQYLSLYSSELRKKRSKFKPGLIPPFYADLPKTLDEIMNSEMKYLRLYEKAPFTTDVKYFFKALKNIIIKSARSN